MYFIYGLSKYTDSYGNPGTPITITIVVGKAPGDDGILGFNLVYLLFAAIILLVGCTIILRKVRDLSIKNPI